MYNEQTVGVVVPAYNEETFIREVVETLPAFVDRAYVVDDGSTDDTWEELQAAAARVNEERSPPSLVGGADPPTPSEQSGRTPARPTSTDGGGYDRVVVPIRHETNRGAGGAVKTGYRAALDDGVDVVALIAGDGQTDPALIERLVEPVAAGRADYAKGNRLESGDREPMPRLRQVGNATLTLLTRIASGYWTMTDSQNGSTAISRAALERIDVDAVYDGYGWCNDLLVRCNTRDLRVVDVPHAAVYEDETSHISFSSYVPLVSMLLLRGFLRRLGRKYLSPSLHPVGVCYLVGASLCAAGGIGWLRDRDDLLDGSVSVWGVVLLLVGMLWDAVDNAPLQTAADEE